MEINYKKNKNKELFEQMRDEKFLNLESMQNYIPIYDQFFNLNDTNFNSINLNNKYKLQSITEKLDYSKFNGTIIDSCDNVITKKIFFKYSPLLDPIKYMIGKFEASYNILNLPTFKENHKNEEVDTNGTNGVTDTNGTNGVTDTNGATDTNGTNGETDTNEDNSVHKKILDSNNSAYIDGFFSFLSSLLLNNYNFLNGIDYYGSYIAIKKDFVVEIDEDIEYLDESDFFHKNNNMLFKILNGDKYPHLFNNTKKCKQKLTIEYDNLEQDPEELLKDSIIDIVDNTDENAVSENVEVIDMNIEEEKIEEGVKMAEDEQTKEEKNDNTELTITNIDKQNSHNNKTNEHSHNSSSCSSRCSETNSTNDESSNDNSNSSEDDSSSAEEEIFASINQFPIETIALECCDDTLDSYIENNKIKDNEWESIVIQILFSLITYQDVFDLTHNDLHTNNIVYINTEKKFLYYKYKNAHYKIPTFGKIYKIIDFGRAIYKFKGNTICSDSYACDGDANSQYNCEPYMNCDKPRLDPNYSFDLCRLGCSLFDNFIDDIDDIKKLKSPIKKLMVSWVFDDNNKNILYKNNGEERYPDFKLYKMIARTVHNHTPQKVLRNNVFDKYQVNRKKINNQGAIFNIDELPCMV
tara:strand:+ start:1581 stop:3491 length:1911 start_codon:yes stop_codon:yes gene_type:complete